MPGSALTITARDRLTFTLFLAIVLHLILLLGVAFEAPERDPAPSSVEVILAHVPTSTPQDEADFIAQADQAGSGDQAEKQIPETNQQSINPDAQTRPVQPTEAAVAKAAPEVNEVITTTNTSARKMQVQTSSEARPKLKLKSESTLASLNRQIEMASYEAALAEQRRQYAKRPRKRVLTTASTKRAQDAAYLLSWREKVERIGNLNYPHQARSQKLYGSLRLMVAIKADGSLREMKLLKSSGHNVLDQAAMEIVRLAAPFAPFPPEIRKDTDVLEIIRTWRFERGSLSSY